MSSPPSEPRRTAGRAVVRLGLITGVSGFLLLLVATGVAVSTSSVTSGVVVRALLITALLVATVRAMAGELYEPRDGRYYARVAAGLLLGYALQLGWWGGHAYAAQLVIDASVVRAVADGLLWVGVGLAVARRYEPSAGE